MSWSNKLIPALSSGQAATSAARPNPPQTRGGSVGGYLAHFGDVRVGMAASSSSRSRRRRRKRPTRRRWNSIENAEPVLHLSNGWEKKQRCNWLNVGSHLVDLPNTRMADKITLVKHWARPTTFAQTSAHCYCSPTSFQFRASSFERSHRPIGNKALDSADAQQPRRDDMSSDWVA